MHLLKRKPTSPKTHEAKILEALKTAGSHGMWNFELAREGLGGLAWHRRITDLRVEGYNIQHERQFTGGHKYYLIQNEEKP